MRTPHPSGRSRSAPVRAVDAEAAIVLRRACSIGMSRGLDLDRYETLAEMPGLRPLCWSMQPERAPVAFRQRGLIRDYDDRPEAFLAPLRTDAVEGVPEPGGAR